jgi:outer membrane receptor for ferrienterochelin and colicins
MSKTHALHPGACLALVLGFASQAGAATPPDTQGDADSPPRTTQTVVTGSRTEQRATDATVPTEVITRREIEATGARDLGELLQAHPGIEVVHSFRGAGLRLQGLDPQYVLILIDGERVAGRVDGTFDLSRFTLRDVERVEIVKGPASVLYGSDAIGGVVNLITRRPRNPLEGEARASYGSRGEVDLRGTAGSAMGPWAGTAGGAWRRGEGFDLEPSDVATTRAAFNAWEAGGDLDFHASDTLRFSTRVDYLRNETLGIDLAPSGAIFDRRNRTELFGASLRARWEANADTRVSARLNNSLFRDQLLLDQRFARDLDVYNDVRERLWEAGVQLDQRIGDAHQVSAGLEGLRESLMSPRLSNGFGLRYRLGLLAQDDWKVLANPRVTVTYGARLDIDSRFGTRPSPRIAVRYDPLDALTLRASYGWGFRAPSFQEQLLRFENPGVGYVVEGNPNLKPEISQGLNLSADWRLGEGLILSASLYRTDVQDLVTVVSLGEVSPDQPVRFSYGNVAQARSQGGEVSARLRVLSGVWLDLGYALTDIRDLGTGQSLEGRAPHRGTVQLYGRYRPWGLDVTVRGTLMGPRPFYLDQNGDGVLEPVWAGGYADFSLRLAKQIGPVSAFALLTNFLNAGHPLFAPIPPRGFQVGVSARY